MLQSTEYYQHGMISPKCNCKCSACWHYDQ